MAVRRGCIASRRLLRQVWRRRGGGNSERVRTYIMKLRRKLGDDAANPTYIFNERWVGYRMAKPGSGVNPSNPPRT